MSDLARAFPHTRLKFLKSGTAVPGGPPRRSKQSIANSGNRDGHGKSLKSSVSTIAASWQSTLETRKQEGLPDLPNAVSLLLQVDPASFDADKLKSFGIEVILELEDGYILGASADADFTKLQQKIAQFIAEDHGGGKIAEIFQILEGQLGRLEHILSPDLLAKWDVIDDKQIYTVDISVACVGLNPQFPGFPKEKEGRDPVKSADLAAKWLDKRNQTLQEWDDLLDTRETDFRNFVAEIGGRIPQSIFYEDRSHLNLLPDSFSCQVEISGKGLKDIALNYSYVFEISEPEQFTNLDTQVDNLPESLPNFALKPPDANAPRICVIDSGIQENHPLLKAAIDHTNSRSWVPNQKEQTADQVEGGGHGTRVAGALLYPQGIPHTDQAKAICWIQNARVLDEKCHLSKRLHVPDVLIDIVTFYHQQARTRLFNHSVASLSPCRITYMSAWAATIDYLTWQNDILFIVAAGNIRVHRVAGLSPTRGTLVEYHQAGIPYPDYLLEASARIGNPAQSFQALTVGSIAPSTYSQNSKRSIAEANHPSAFSCTGYGIWNSIKPDVVEYGGDFAIDSDTEPNFSTPAEICPELVRTTKGGAPAVASDSIGTSFAAPKVAHIAAALEATFPQASCLLYRALIVQSARLPEWTDDPAVNLSDAIRMMGYGLPNLARAIGNANDRITLITQEEKFIQARQAHIYQVGIPPELQSPADDFDIRVEITLSYKAEPRRTRRSKRKYLSTWLHWECSHKGELPDIFLRRVLKNHETSDSDSDNDGLLSWTLGQQKNHGNKVKDTSRSIGTIQKDWTTIKSFNLREKFCIAVVAHQGWNNDPTAQIPYALTVSFEVIGAAIPIYGPFVEAQVDLIEPPINVQVQQSVKVTV
jgi:Subtilase family